jgi:hypothetical protein
VGGSYPEDQSQLSKVALRWMLCEAEIAGLKINPQRKTDILGGESPYVSPDPLSKWQHESLHGIWWIAELWPKKVSVHDSSGAWKERFRINLGRRRTFAPNSLVHESVQQRLQGTAFAYKPKNLPDQFQFVSDRCTPQSQSASAAP